MTCDEPAPFDDETALREGQRQKAKTKRQKYGGCATAVRRLPFIHSDFWNRCSSSFSPLAAARVSASHAIFCLPTTVGLVASDAERIGTVLIHVIGLFPFPEE